jgi:transcriptional regulator with XRE-family HTH domain
MSPRQLGMRLRRIRKTKGLTQDALAKKARITRIYVINLEAGKYDPTVGVAKRLAKALGVPVTELLE